MRFCNCEILIGLSPFFSDLILEVSKFSRFLFQLALECLPLLVLVTRRIREFTQLFLLLLLLVFEILDRLDLECFLVLNLLELLVEIIDLRLGVLNLLHDCLLAVLVI